MQVHSESAPPSPVENLRWLEDQLDVTYSPACCSYNAGTTTLLLRLPNAASANGGDLPNRGVAPADASSLEVLGWQREGATEQNLVDIFGRIQDIEALQPQRQPGFSGSPAGGLLERLSPSKGHSCLLSSEPTGALAQIEENVALCAEDEASNSGRGEPALSTAEFKPSEEAYSLRTLINNCLMFPGTRKLSAVRKKNCTESDARLKDPVDASYTRGLQFLQWRGRFPKATASGSSPIGGGGSGSAGFAENEKMVGGGFAASQHEARLAREKLRQASRFLLLRKSGGVETTAETTTLPAVPMRPILSPGILHSVCADLIPRGKSEVATAPLCCLVRAWTFARGQPVEAVVTRVLPSRRVLKRVLEEGW
ncbi:hypothetical protein Efla_004504 [Eimeria flavescens]